MVGIEMEESSASAHAFHEVMRRATVNARDGDT